MKITLEDNSMIQTTEVHNDVMSDLGDILEQLIAPALRGWGFDKEAVDEAMKAAVGVGEDTEEEASFALKVIYGSYEIGPPFIEDGVLFRRSIWYPNPHIQMSRGEQIEYNEKFDPNFKTVKSITVGGTIQC
jgi:hypothetical protein